MRAIDADALCEDLLNRWSIADTRKEDLIRAVMADIVTPIVVSQPTITPERKRGRWIQDENLRAVCSECGEPCATYIMGAPRDRYCKWCGAQMEEGD